MFIGLLTHCTPRKMDTTEQRNKSHKEHKTGAKAKQQEIARKRRRGLELEPNRGKNVKAFQGPSSNSNRARQGLRSMEKREVTLHMPETDKTFGHLTTDPPVLVCVVGPPQCGKTTLIRSMVKFYGGRNVRDPRGGITVIAGRTRRITFFECPNTVPAMCDVAKVADVILLMMDGTFGFEMETFEFLSIAQVHGMPKMIGVISHLDQLKTSKALKKRKTFLRHRFWYEVAQGAKVLCLAPMLQGLYRGTDVLKLHRLLLVVQPKMQHWRSTHSCVLIDRHDDITNPDSIAQDPNCNRSLAFHGYVRGRPMKLGQMVHIPGAGDFTVAHISHEPDPCDFFDHRKKDSKSHKMRHLTAKQRKYYAPYCDAGGVSFDEDAVYVADDADRANIDRSGEGLELLRGLQQAKPIEAKKRQLDVLRRPLRFDNEDTLDVDVAVEPPSDNDERSSSDDSDEYEQQRFPTTSLDDFGPAGGGDSNHEEDEGLPELALAPRLPHDDDTAVIHKPQHDDTLYEDEMFIARLKRLFVTGRGALGGTEGDGEDGSGAPAGGDRGYDSHDEEFEQGIRRTGKRQRGQAEAADDDGEGGSNAASDDAGDDEADGALQQPPTTLNALANVRSSRPSALLATKLSGKARRDAPLPPGEFDLLAEDAGATTGPSLGADTEELVAQFLAATTTSSGRGKGSSATHDHLKEGDVTYFSAQDARGGQAAKTSGPDAETNQEMAITESILQGKPLSGADEDYMKKKLAKKEKFNEEYDVEGGKTRTLGYYHTAQRAVEEKKQALDTALADIQADLEKKIRLVGYFSGLYVRFVLHDVPVEFVQHFDPKQPLIAGGLNPGEEKLQLVHAKIKRHRWYPRILKSGDPLLLSMGWRRIQTMPIYASEDSNGRLRYVKYTPQHMHCFASFYAPVAPTNTGFIAIPPKELRVPGFRLLATGYTVGNDSVTAIVKKLKLTGTPASIQKTTVFVKGMFTSDIEAAKFVGAKLKAVSGLRGIIKAVMKGKNGLVRATFEDKLLLSDIVFLRAWKPVEPTRFCANQTSLLGDDWRPMKTMAELRRQHGVVNEAVNESKYTDVVQRRGRVRDPKKDGADRPMLSRNLRLQLPFDMKEEFVPLQPSRLEQQRIAATVVAPEPKELRRKALLDAFEDKATQLAESRHARKAEQARIAKRALDKETSVYERKLKQAKKETARKAEFRSQHKSRGAK